ncbi:RNA polymerase sigma-70 factor [Mariniphaga sediminis]|uniref:RNA polymerase sigma-70 factor n=1 Tax=Mariniphaga sediminis TaxID=1628158 RepID=A0A399D636_9BACT|nr:RNA polymerase sigma-70 factor [Mariniphaga sediminis]RIH67099.1 RNA polymerase sigma-70 factor [Mariniphaga sediminis]
MNPKESEIELIKAFKKGDTKAFEKLFQKYHKKLFSFLFNLLNSKEDTEEIIQETFLRIWETREHFWEEYPFESLLYRIARNTSLNYNRKRVNRAIFEKNFSFIANLSAESADQYLLFKETQSIIETILNGLPPKRKEIFLLQKVEGLSRQEIAEKLQISVITVDHQLFKANKYVKDEFKKFSLLMFNILFL